MNRDQMRQAAGGREDPWDLLIVGGGATGIGAALDAAARGYDVLLLEQSDFGKATSSRSTKLIHGGVRYLRQGNIPLVRESLRERAALLRNAPHLVHPLPFVVPAYRWWDKPFYGIGLKLYDLLGVGGDFDASSIVSRDKAVALVPTLAADGLRGGIVYSDGQFDDARLLINLAQTAAEQGATLLNYCRVERLLKGPGGRVDGVEAIDLETSKTFSAHAKCVINATGAFADHLRTLDDPGARSITAPSQGAHVVLDRKFLPGKAALMVPKTSDGRLLFAIPYHDHVLVGTTDTAVSEVPLEPRPLAKEIDFILETAGRYLRPQPERSDVLSAFAGIRPLVTKGGNTKTSKLARNHEILVSDSGLLTIAGGKWTTYRKMAEDCVDRAVQVGGLPPRPCTTHGLHIHGFVASPPAPGPLAIYGSDAVQIEALNQSAEIPAPLHPRIAITPGQVIWAARSEMARSVDDVLARRTRILQLDARAAHDLAEPVARLLAAELGRGDSWVEEQVREFQALAAGYLLDADEVAAEF